MFVQGQSSRLFKEKLEKYRLMECCLLNLQTQSATWQGSSAFPEGMTPKSQSESVASTSLHDQ
jgi:hypothetical protein